MHWNRGLKKVDWSRGLKKERLEGRVKKKCIRERRVENSTASEIIDLSEH